MFIFRKIEDTRSSIPEDQTLTLRRQTSTVDEGSLSNILIKNFDVAIGELRTYLEGLDGEIIGAVPAPSYLKHLSKREGGAVVRNLASHLVNTKYKNAFPKLGNEWSYYDYCHSKEVEKLVTKFE